MPNMIALMYEPKADRFLNKLALNMGSLDRYLDHPAKSKTPEMPNKSGTSVLQFDHEYMIPPWQDVKMALGVKQWTECKPKRSVSRLPLSRL